MKTLIKIVLVLIPAMGWLSLNGQQAPMYTHYMNNILMVNPAYAGSRDALSLTALHRSQWVGFTGAPMTQTFSVHSPLRNENVGLGLSISNDRIGPINNTSVFVDYAYMIRLSEKSKLAFGLSAGVNIYKANLSSLELDQQADPVYQNNINYHATPNFGFGVYYSRERFYAGISAPDIIQNSFLVADMPGGNDLIEKEKRHYFFITGVLLDMSDNLVFMPTTLVKVTPGAPIQVDLTASFIIRDRILAGVMFRSGDAVGGLVGFDITDQFHLGYSYDWSYGLRTGTYNQGSHELVLRYDVNLNKKQTVLPEGSPVFKNRF